MTPSPTRLPAVVGPTMEDLRRHQAMAEEAQAHMESVMQGSGRERHGTESRRMAMQHLFDTYGEYVAWVGVRSG